MQSWSEYAAEEADVALNEEVEGRRNPMAGDSARLGSIIGGVRIAVTRGCGKGDNGQRSGAKSDIAPAGVMAERAQSRSENDQCRPEIPILRKR